MSERDILFQMKPPYEETTRGLLQNALPANSFEAEALGKYKEILNSLNDEETILENLQKALLSSKSSKGDIITGIKKLAAESAKLISQYDRQLIEMEHTELIISILAREREGVRLRQKQANDEALRAYKERAYAEAEEFAKKHREEREKVLERIRNKQLTQDTNDTPNEKVYVEESPKEWKVTLKEKFFDSLGLFGVVLYILIRTIIAVLPFVMIGGNFFLTLLLISINTFVPFASAVFWIWGLVCAIKGVQDIWAIMFYIAFVLIWIPFYIKAIAALFSKD